IAQVVAACAYKGVACKYGVNVAAQTELLAPFDRLVVATGARYRFGLGPAATAALRWGIGRWSGVTPWLSKAAVRDWFYHRARLPTADRITRLTRPAPTVVVVAGTAPARHARDAVASH